MSEVTVINGFWLAIWEVVIPICIFIFLTSIIFQMKHSFERKRSEKAKQKERAAFLNRFVTDSDDVLSLNRAQILNAIVYLLKNKASYKIYTPSGTYDSPTDREVLIEYYQEFFQKLGFK